MQSSKLPKAIKTSPPCAHSSRDGPEGALAEHRHLIELLLWSVYQGGKRAEPSPQPPQWARNFATHPIATKGRKKCVFNP